LLTDFIDAHEAVTASDALLLEQAVRGIDALNAKHGGGRDDVFFLFHRPRRYNERERIWMGFERKRGKLTELNALLRGRGRDRFSDIVGDLEGLPRIKYVITLDTDTQLPRNAARELAGTMAHPLNRPVHDSVHRQVIDGYAILQPRVSASLADLKSLYAACKARSSIPTRAVSDAPGPLRRRLFHRQGVLRCRRSSERSRPLPREPDLEP
jgi:hypothetical protein